MDFLKEFFNLRITLNCMLFSSLISVLLVWRFVHVEHLPFFSEESLQAYFLFFSLCFVVLRISLFILYLLGRREERS